MAPHPVGADELIHAILQPRDSLPGGVAGVEQAAGTERRAEADLDRAVSIVELGEVLPPILGDRARLAAIVSVQLLDERQVDAIGQCFRIFHVNLLPRLLSPAQPWQT